MNQNGKNHKTRITFVKIGFIGASAFIETLIDERSSRSDIIIKSVSSGTQMDVTEVKELMTLVSNIKSDLIVLIAPAIHTDGPTTAFKKLSETNIPVIVISTKSTKKIKHEGIVDNLEKHGFGYILCDADPMIGVKKEFLDPIETSLFNSDLIKVMSVTGIYRTYHMIIDKIIDQIKKCEKIVLPKIVLNREIAIENCGLTNPYAKSKALGSYELLKKVNTLNIEGSYKEDQKEKYMFILQGAHEILRQASILADEAREIEKGIDHVERINHDKNGKLMKKTSFMSELSDL